jgi:hypothetical protein
MPVWPWLLLMTCFQSNYKLSSSNLTLHEVTDSTAKRNYNCIHIVQQYKMDLLWQWDTTWLVDKFIMVKNRFIPWDVKELKNTSHPLTRMQDKLFIVHHETTRGSHFTALVIHSLNCRVPLCQTLAIACQIKPCDSHLHNHCHVKCDIEQSKGTR